MEKSILFKIDEKTHELLKETAKNTKKSKSELIRQAIKEYLQKGIQDNVIDTITYPCYPLVNKLNCKIDNLTLRFETLELKLEKFFYMLKGVQIQADENSLEEDMKETQIELAKRGLFKKTE